MQIWNKWKKFWIFWLIKPCPNNQQPWAPLNSCLALWKLKELMPTKQEKTIRRWQSIFRELFPLFIMSVNRNCGGQENFERELLVGLLERQIKTPVWLQKTWRKIYQTLEWWCTVLLCSDSCTNMTVMEEPSEENFFLHPHHKIQCQRFAREHRNKPDAYWK